MELNADKNKEWIGKRNSQMKSPTTGKYAQCNPVHINRKGNNICTYLIMLAYTKNWGRIIKKLAKRALTF
jgi:hypothetical protein